MDARNFAILKHRDQMYGSWPYIIHLQDVWLKASMYDLSSEQQNAAYLHDTIEDTGTLKSELVENFGADTAEMVYRVTGIGQTRAERTADTITKLTSPANLAVYEGSINVKMCDRMSNLEASVKTQKWDLVKLYLKEAPLYDDVFSQGNPSIYQDINFVYERAQIMLNQLDNPEKRRVRKM